MIEVILIAKLNLIALVLVFSLSISVSAQVLTFEATDTSISMNGMNVAESGGNADYPSPNLMLSYSLGSGKTGSTASASSGYSSTGALMQFDFGEGSKWSYLSSIDRTGRNVFEDKSPATVSWELPLLVAQDWKPVSYSEGLSEIPEGQDVHFILNGKLKLPGKFVIYSAEGDNIMSEVEVKDANTDCSSPNSRCSATLLTGELPPGYYYITYADQAVQISTPMALKVGDPKDNGESTIVLKDPVTGKSTVLKWTPKVTTATYVKGNVNNQKISVIQWRDTYPSGISIGTSTKNVVYDMASLGFPGLTFEVSTDWKTYTSLNFNNGNVITFTTGEDDKPIITSTGDWNSNGITVASSTGKSFVLTTGKKVQLTTTLQEECTPELIARLQAEKAELEKLASDLENQQREAYKEYDAINADLSSMMEEQASIKAAMDSLMNQITSIDAEITEITSKLQSFSANEGKLRKRIEELTRILADAEGLGVHNGPNPMDGIDSGGAISYDGGGSWITFNGNAGAEKFLERMRELREIKEELLGLSRELNGIDKEKQSLESQQKSLEARKDPLEKDLAERKDRYFDLANSIAEKEGEKKKVLDRLDDISENAKELNNMISAFNEKAEACGIQARHTLIDAMNQLKKMPSDMQSKVRAGFDEQATDEEKSALAKSGYVSDSDAGSVTTAADKLKKVMKEVSKCEEGTTKEMEYLSSTYDFTLNGAEKVWVADWQGIRGKKMSVQKELYNDATFAISAINTIDLVSDIIDLTTDLNPVPLIYGQGFQDQATSAIMGQIKNWISSGVLAGPPMWIQVGFGRLWERDISKTVHQWNIYICKEGIWQFSEKKIEVEVEKSDCRYTGNGFHEYEVPLDELDWVPSQKGSWSDTDIKKWNGAHPTGWPDSFRKAVSDAFDNELRGYVLGRCE